MKLWPAITTLALALAASAAEPVLTPPAASPTETGAAALRVLGGLVFVLALFLGGVWLLRNWQRVAAQHGHAPKLGILEVKSLGNRNALYVISYEQQRLLLASSTTGVTLVSHLPNAEPGETATPAPRGFAEALQQVLTRRVP